MLLQEDFQPIVCHIMMRPHYLGLRELFQKASKSETICLTSTYYNIDPHCMIFLILPDLMDLKSLNQCTKLMKCLFPKLLDHSLSVSTTPLRQLGFRQCFSWTTLRDKQLRDKHCRHPIAVMGVVDMFELGLLQIAKFSRAMSLLKI